MNSFSYLCTFLVSNLGFFPLQYNVNEHCFIVREQQKKLASLHVELDKARQEGFVPKHPSENSGTQSKKKLLAVIGIVTRFGGKNNRDAIRKAWMSTGIILSPILCFDHFLWHD